MVVMSNLTNERFPTDSLFVFESGAINVIQAHFADNFALKDPFSTFAPTYGNMFKILDCN